MTVFAKVFSLLLVASAAMQPLVAQEQAMSLSGDVKVEKTTVNADGETTTELLEPNTIVPGDRLIFGTDYTNSSAETVENFVVTNPLPTAVRLAADADPALTVSVDDGATWGTLTELSVIAEDGTSRPAEHADVTHIRWTLASVAPGESGRLEYPAIIR